ncbi:unconventional myosin-XIX [Halictus rubicundus]|uniref:unconventional myosin-XIX n=1 Tax=Halictus rubicundus TaxID=77578 RepID=UPI004035F9DA
MAATRKPVSPIGWDLLNDLSALPEDTIIDFLLERLQHGQIYTWVGPLLLALNPNNEVSTSQLYNFSEFDKHVDMSEKMYESNPHIFTVAAKAHYNLTQQLGRNCQVIVISGETETGKTFNAVKCLEFFSRMNKHSTRDGDRTPNIMLRITDACRFVSAFTTASTERNEVSSRHGQLIRFHYEAGAISGATINSFLMERSRVTRGSSNFHIFYQMIFGLSNVDLQKLHLSKYRNYDILNIVDYSKKTYFQEGFQDTLKAMDVLRFGDDQKKHILETLALLIHMGNITFKKIGEACTIDLDDKESREALESTCKLSCLTEDVVTELLTTILIDPKSTWRKHTTYHRCLVTVDACRTRLYSIIRHLYDLLFYWVLCRANDALSVKREYSQWLGILDIFGFESFNKNGMEQLCVNYANEKMQQYFMGTYLENSRKHLQEEGFVDSNEPSDTIDIYKERLTVLEEALFLTLNDASQSPIATSVSEITQLVYKKLRGVQNKFLGVREDNFVVQHYSCPVAYSIEDLLSKNTDKVPNEISMIFRTSENAFLRSLFKIEKDPGLQFVSSSTRKKTMLAKLKYSIDTLLKELSKCDLHYVRCIKPSRLNNREWDKQDFRKQLACTGIFDALSLAKCKYPIRLHYKEFYRRYSKQPEDVVDVGKCKMILEAVEPEQRWHTSVHYGRQLIFLTEPAFFKLEANRRKHLVDCANKIQRFWIRHRRNRIPDKPIEYDATNEIVPGKESKQSSSSEDDDVFISSPGFWNDNENVDTKETPIENFVEISRSPNSNATETDVERTHLNVTEKESKQSSSSKDDDVFISSPGFWNDNVLDNENVDTKETPIENFAEISKSPNSNATETNVERIHLNVTEKLVEVCSEGETAVSKEEVSVSEMLRDTRNVREKKVHKHRLINSIKNNVKKLIGKIIPNKLPRFRHQKVYKNHIEIKLTDSNNNFVREYFESKTSNSNGKRCTFYDTGKRVSTIQPNDCILFHGNRIVSRRRLCEVPIMIPIARPMQSSNLYSVHILPCTELPRGLQDCL